MRQSWLLPSGVGVLGLVAALALLAAGLTVVPTVAPAQQQMTEEELAKIPAGPQPIKFSHRVHATDNSIPCQYCHIYADRSQVAGVPPVGLCMGCHQMVATDLSEVEKLAKFWEEKKPIPWVKIHDVPDFVRFRHDRHVNASNEAFPNGVECQKCHGPVEEMDVVQVSDPNFGLMGWCLECHLTVPGVKERKRTLPEAPGSERIANAIGPDGLHRPYLTDCLTCHK